MTHPPTIEIHGTGTHNRGAELMAVAIAARLRAEIPEVRLVVPQRYGDFCDRARRGFWTTWEFTSSAQRRWRGLARRLARCGLGGAALRCESLWQRCVAGHPENRTAGGVLDPAEIDLVLDASGFAFSDQWGPGPARALLEKMQSPARRHTPLILLPQAFGPFRQRAVADWTRRLIQRSSLCFARDAVSLAALQQLLLQHARQVRQCPDFTMSLPGYLPRDLQLPARFAAVVPNFRMIDKGGNDQAYLQFLSRLLRRLTATGQNPVLVLHDAAEDRQVIDRLPADSPQPPIITHTDPQVLKGILGRAEWVVASRFHALVSALSSGVPCIGAGWSHKYAELFSDFDCAEFLVSDLLDTRKLDEMLDQLGQPDQRDRLHQRISNAGTRLKEQSTAMWDAVLQQVREKRGRGRRQTDLRPRQSEPQAPSSPEGHSG